MTEDIDFRALKEEARRLTRTASVPPLRFTLLYFAVRIALSEAGAAANYLLVGRSAAEDAVALPISFPGVLASLVGSVLLAGYACYALGVQEGRAMPYGSLFRAFPFAGHVVLLQVLTGLLIGLGLTFFVVPGIVLAMTYALSTLHLCEAPDMGAIAAMRASREEMRGRKWQLFLLLLSFWPLLLAAGAAITVFDFFLLDYFPYTLGGELLSTLCYGVLTACAQLYLTPYLNLTLAAYYRRVKKGDSYGLE